jgi:hypothetical protein
VVAEISRTLAGLASDDVRRFARVVSSFSCRQVSTCSWGTMA